ncbi:hypothetical protein BRC62_02665 [Halobacteriales archaeon QH_10_67_13]|nr:MAG: hypothetical protein BRC62_02665 [Halobacteriales archaeon QH_10_67_13]
MSPSESDSTSPATIVPPTERSCERCGRRERWDDDEQTWRGLTPPGTPHCLHEWDITGTYNPLSEE